jgi:hypothetical protein
MCAELTHVAGRSIVQHMDTQNKLGNAHIVYQFWRTQCITASWYSVSVETSDNIPNPIQAIIFRIMKWHSINVTFVELSRKTKEREEHWICTSFLSSTIFFRKKIRVCSNKFSANEAPITSEMRAETHVHVVVNEKCVIFDNLIETEILRPILVELPKYAFVYMRLVWVRLKSL